jgi:hypothetical protein
MLVTTFVNPIESPVLAQLLYPISSRTLTMCTSALRLLPIQRQEHTYIFHYNVDPTWINHVNSVDLQRHQTGPSYDETLALRARWLRCQLGLRRPRESSVMSTPSSCDEKIKSKPLALLSFPVSSNPPTPFPWLVFWRWLKLTAYQVNEFLVT